MTVSLHTFSRARPRARPSHFRGSAFTLIEVLTVITLVGILSAILIPVTGKVRASARASKCMSNLRQVGSAFNLYAHEHQQKFPAAQDPITGELWYEALQPYVGTNADLDPMDRDKLNAVFLCPDWKQNAAEWAGGEFDIGYAMSTALSGQAAVNQAIMIEQIKNPSQAILVVENPALTSPYFPATDGLELDSVVPLFFETPENYPQGTGRHDHRANYLYADGHVRGCTIEDAKAHFERSGD
jgi:prepilin-type processing-associated H-X9-DG protein/prepilin-type N-terminal cleavage/methylation domain-containing protein